MRLDSTRAGTRLIRLAPGVRVWPALVTAAIPAAR